MPIILSSPIEVKAPIRADEFIVCGFQVRERNPSTGEPLPNPAVTIYWVSRLGGVRVDSGALDAASAQLGALMPDGTVNLRGNLKAISYRALKDAGIFPAGSIS